MMIKKIVPVILLFVLANLSIHPELYAKNVNDVDSTLKLKTISLVPNPFSPNVTENTIKGGYEIKGSALEGKVLTHFLKQDVTIKNSDGAIVGYISSESEITYRPAKGNEIVSWEVISKWNGNVNSTLLPDGKYTLEITGTLIDRKDNKKDDKIRAVTSAGTGTVSLDSTPPETTAGVIPQPNADGWLKSDAVIKLTAIDNLSGVVSTFYKQNNGNPVAGMEFEIAAEGIHNVSYWSVDNAGNTETAKDLSLKIDKTAPTASAAVTPAANAEGWNNSNVTVKITSHDALSGIDKTFYKIGDGETAEGTDFALNANATVTFWCIDKAGNQSEVGTVSVKIDKDAPALTSSQAPAANANGWNNANVVVTFAAEDAISGIASVKVPVTVDQEGANIEVAGEAIDKAGNKATATHTVNIDKTAPVISGIVPAAGTKITEPRPEISADIADALSGVDAASITVTLNGNAVPAAFDPQTGKVTVTLADDLESGDFQVTVTAADKAGNAATASSNFSVSLAPIVTEQLGSSGFVSGGTWVEFLGSNFAESISVKFGEDNASEISYFNDGKIYALTPAGQAGKVDVTLSNGPGRSLVLPNAFEYLPELELKIDGLGNLKDGDIITGKTKLTLSGTVSGGMAPYRLELTHYSNPATRIIPITGNSWQVTVDFEEGFHYVVFVLSDAEGHFYWISFYYFYDSTPPAAPANVKAYITDNGDGATLIWPASDSKDTVQYEITITGEGTSKTETVDADVFNYYTVAGLASDKEYTASIKAIDGAENKSLTEPSVTFTPEKFYYSHDLKKIVEQKLISLSDNPAVYSQVLWHNDGGKIDLADLRETIGTLSNKTFEEEEAKLSLIETDDIYGNGAKLLNTAWKTITVPDPYHPWLNLNNYSSILAETYFQQIGTELSRISQWKKSSGYQVIKKVVSQRGGGSYSPISWKDCLENYASWGEWSWEEQGNLEGYFGTLRSADYCWWSDDGVNGYSEWYAWANNEYKFTFDIKFLINPLLEKYFWTDFGAITPNSQINQVYEFGAEPALETWGNPKDNLIQNDPYYRYGISNYYCNYGVVTSNIYGSYILRNLEQVAVYISPEKANVSIGQEISMHAEVEYKCKLPGAKNGVYDKGEAFVDQGNGQYDPGEKLTYDQNRNGQYDTGDSFEDLGNGVYDPGESYTDEDAVYVYITIPTTIQCSQEGAVVSNHGGSRFVGTKNGTYNISTPQGGEAEILVSGVDVIIFDTSGNKMSASAEDTCGVLLPLFDGNLNILTGKVTFKSYVPEELEGSYMVSVADGIELWDGNKLIIDKDNPKEFFTKADLEKTYDVKGTKISDNIPVTVQFIETGKTIPTYHDSGLFSVVGLELGEVKGYRTGSIHSLEVKKVYQKQNDFWLISCLPDGFKDGKDYAFVAWENVLRAATNDDKTFKIKNLTFQGTPIVKKLMPLTPNPGDPINWVMNNLINNVNKQNIKTALVCVDKPGDIEIKIEGEPAIVSAGNQKVKTEVVYTIRLTILRLEIIHPKDSIDIKSDQTLAVSDYFNTNTDDGPYCYAYQGVASSAPGDDVKRERIKEIEGNISLPETPLVMLPSVKYKWFFRENRAGQIEVGSDKLKPKHVPPDTISGNKIDDELVLQLEINDGENPPIIFEDSKEVEIFQDHLARDVSNFADFSETRKRQCSPIEVEQGIFANNIKLTCGPAMIHAEYGEKTFGGKELEAHEFWTELRKNGWIENGGEASYIAGSDEDDNVRTIGYEWDDIKDENGNVIKKGFKNLELKRGWKVCVGVYFAYYQNGILIENETQRHYQTVKGDGENPLTYAGDSTKKIFRHETAKNYFDDDIFPENPLNYKFRVWVLRPSSN